MPCGITASLPEETKKKVYDKCTAFVKELNAAGIRSKADCRENYSPGWKFNHWELKVGFCKKPIVSPLERGLAHSDGRCSRCISKCFQRIKMASLQQNMLIFQLL